MANRSLFASYVGKLLPKANAQNREGAPAYALSPKHQLAQIAATGTLSRTFYAAAREQLEDVTGLAGQISPRRLQSGPVRAAT
jgi:60 kDa SS-A/Ro ribonucleoprotein